MHIIEGFSALQSSCTFSYVDFSNMFNKQHDLQVFNLHSTQISLSYIVCDALIARLVNIQQ